MFYKILMIIFRLLLPTRLFNAFKRKTDKTILLMTSSDVLRVFWIVILSPIKLVFSLVRALIFTLIVWLVPLSIYNDCKYSVNLFYDDVILSGTSIHIALKRQKRLWEIFIKGRERTQKFGELNPDKTFFVIRPYYYMERNELATSLSDLLFHYYRNLQQLSYAVENGWIPVVDWQNYGPFRHAEDYPIHGTTNCWEYYWKQPSEYTLEEVYQSKNVILANRNSIDYGFIPSMYFTPPFNYYAERLATECPQYANLFKLNDETASYINEHQKNLFPEGARILGVSVRGNSYGNRRVKNHPIQPTFSDLVKLVRKYIEEWNMDYIFFSCESAVFVEKMKVEFGDKLICLPRLRYKKEPSENPAENPLYQKGQKYQTNLDYLTEMVLLSRCKGLIAGMTGGIRCVLAWNAGEYEYTHIFDKGVWK